MFEKFLVHGKKNHFWNSGSHILLAISGGVDSMVLLNLMEQVAEHEQVTIGVAHVNHQLRLESEIEANFIKDYCKKKHVPYYEMKWVAQNKKSNLEAKARAVRYGFFEEIMNKNNYDTLMTAHHSDDQAETILMKLTRGSILTNLVGIRTVQPFGNGKLIRPFLIFSKDELKELAKESEIVYFEDSSNQTNDYFRNRIRHQIVPVLKKENTKFLTRIEQFSEQVTFADELIESVIKPKYDRWVVQKADCWQIDLVELKNEKKSTQYFFFVFVLQKALVDKGLEINQAKIDKMIQIIVQSGPQKSISLGKNWFFVTQYDVAYIYRRENEAKSLVNVNHQINLSEGFFLSTTEWIGIEEVNKQLVFPDEIMDWSEETLLISDQISLPLTIRHRQNGDRLMLSETLTKKISRLFIDLKVPNEERKNAWLILSSEQEVIWVPKFGNSYLSIPKETDKLFYRIRYKIKA